MKRLISILVQYKQWILSIVIISTWKLQLRLSRLLNKLGVPNIIAKILTKIHHKSRHYTHQYNKGYWKYVMMLY